MQIPNDIEKKIIDDFHGEEQEIVKLLFQRICQYNTYSSQVLRSILFLSIGDFKKVIRYYLTYEVDPRDVIGEAEEKAGNPGHWFSIPFDEMPEFSGKLPNSSEQEVDSDLPF
jgi:hypothetical protein